ncbi:MAU2 chromatid cohesion factor-like [Oopsacas minuta]|uniref:MAU2 chromatid cohesion factor homolog n=1 Tax=Oopsacas minuta TaxID=111878 RepID=A0AAV7K9P2_9METZ|nr:MAU2 chromatid cohesion factor-like [Oopsacas minuta]
MTHHSRSRDRCNSTESEETIESLQTAAIHFYDLKPPRILESILCLHAILSLTPPQRIHARVLLQISYLLYNYCNNNKELCARLEQCRVLCQSLGNINQVKFPCLHLLAKVYLNTGNTQAAKQVLKAAREESEDNLFWYSTFLFQLADLYRFIGDLVSFHTTLARGVKYCEKNSATTAQLYFMLMQFLQYNLEFKYKEAAAVSTDLFTRLEKLEHPSCTILKASHHTISLLSALQLGKILTYKGQLKELQLFAREISHSNSPESETNELTPTGDNFIWIQRDNLFQLVYLISMLHPMQSGATDRAIGYADKALRLISQQTEILLAQPWDGLSGDNIPKTLADQFKTLVLHNLCVCYIVKGSLSEVPLLLQQTEMLLTRPNDPLAHHMLTGLYLFGQDRFKLALSHFQLSLDTPKSGTHTTDVFLQMQALIHMSICYVKLGSQYYDSDVMTQIMNKLKTLRNNHLPSEALNLNAATNFVIGLHQALLQSLPEAKAALKEAVVLANTEDLHKLVACTLILLGKVFMAIGKKEEASTMIPPAFQLANKIQDTDLQIWASTLMAEYLQSAGEEALHRETLSARQQKLALRELELQQVQGVEDGSISMAGWIDEGERLVGSQENCPQGRGEEVLKSPRSPDPKRIRMGHPLTPKTEKDNNTENYFVKPDSKVVPKHDYTGQQDNINKYESQVTNSANNNTQRNQLNTIKEVKNIQINNTQSSDDDVTSQCNQINNYNAIPQLDNSVKTPSMNGTTSHYQNYIEEPVYNYSHTNNTIMMSSENPLTQSACLSQHENVIYQEALSQQTNRQPNNMSSYHIGGRITDQDSDLQMNRSYYQQSVDPGHYKKYQQVMSQQNSVPSQPYGSQSRGIRLLEQGEWAGEENKVDVTPLNNTIQDGQAAHYQHLLQQQQLARQALSRRQKSDVTNSPDPVQNIPVPLDTLTNRYANMQNKIDLTAPSGSLDSFQSRQILNDSMSDRIEQGYSSRNMLEQSLLRQSAFEMQSNMESRLPSINPIQSRQPFKLQSLLQSPVPSPEKLSQSNSHNKRPRISPTPHVIDPLALPTSSYGHAKPLGISPQGAMPPVMLQSYPQSHTQLSPCRQQHGVQLNPTLQNLYTKNMPHNFGQYFLPRVPSYIFPPGNIYPQSQYHTLDPARLQMHPQTREK